MSDCKREADYPPIESHGVIGNMKTLALVTTHGTINWWCYPHFDSNAVFCSLLDKKKGGYWKIGPDVSERLVNIKQFYLPDTNILVTRFFTSEGTGQILDFMPVHKNPKKRKSVNCIMRKVIVRSGKVDFVMKCAPKFNWSRDDKQKVEIFDSNDNENKTHEDVEEEAEPCEKTSFKCSLFIEDLSTKKKAIFTASDGTSLTLLSSCDLTLDRSNGEEVEHITAKFSLKEGEAQVFILRGSNGDDNESSKYCATIKNTPLLFNTTLTFWHKWISKCTYTGRWREMVRRSALVLKLLTFEETGAIVAAGTSSLPEELGGLRNWDYRYTWIRDASFTLYGFIRIGFTEEAQQFMEYLQRVAIETSKRNHPNGPLQIMYKIDGSFDIPEEELTNLEGYQNSAPVRNGNAAFDQLQLDIYGELMDSVYLYNKYGSPISYDLWTHLRKLLDWLADNWSRPDEGIWEMRSGKQHYLYSKVLCWVAFDRGLRLADRRSFPAPREKWMKVRDDIYEEIISKGWNEKRQAFTMFYGSDSLDAATLIMPLVLFMAPNDPKMLKTLQAISPDTSVLKSGGLTKNGMIYRYDGEETDDALIGTEGAFNICTFWYIEALTRAGKHIPELLQDARWKFEDFLSYANHLGLFAEETSTNGGQLGNFPQAFSHLALISAAFNLDRALNDTHQ